MGVANKKVVEMETGLPVLPTVSTEVDIEKVEAKIKATREWVQQAAGLFVEYAEKVEFIKGHVTDWHLNQEVANQVDELEKAINQMKVQVQDLNLNDHFLFSVLLCQLRVAETMGDLHSSLDDAVTQGRLTVVGKEEAREAKDGFCFGKNGYLFFRPQEGEADSSAQKAFKTEIMKALKRVITSVNKANLAEEQAILQQGSENITDLLNEKLGIYRLYLPPHKLSEKRSTREGYLLVRLEESNRGNKVVLVSSTGSCRWLRPGVWVGSNRLHADYSAKSPRIHDRFAGLIRQAIKSWQKSQ